MLRIMKQPVAFIRQNYFFSDKRYDLGEVGRYKINRKLGVTQKLTNKGFN